MKTNDLALRIVKDKPDYELFENNCQNFSKYLVDAISPGSFCVDTIKDMLDRWLDPAVIPLGRLPGTYPRSVCSSSTETRTYFTASEGWERSDDCSIDGTQAISMPCNDSASGPNSEFIMQLSDYMGPTEMDYFITGIYVRSPTGISETRCATSFIAPPASEYIHQRLIAIGTGDGVYMRYFPEAPGLVTSWVKILDHRNVTQIDVREKFDLFLVLADKEFFAYSLSVVMLHGSPTKHQRLQLSKGTPVDFFTTAGLKGREFVLFKSATGRPSVFSVIGPIARDPDAYPIPNHRVMEKGLLRKVDVPLNA
jgi:hypothetical protein